MNTVQSTVGRGSCASPTEQTAKNKAKTHYMPDDRISAVGTDEVQINKVVYESQTKLLILVDEFMMLGNGVTPTEAINELLYDWLVTPYATLASEHNAAKLRIVLELVSFLSKLRDYADEANFLAKEAAREKEVRSE